ncbi:peptidoglycan DD-metalloendopeptidase family protein [Nodosilinea sp. LEGE 06152]|uniref:M23 family metallopeptidase n=1 Tax=Nodosilinea sp. LEGE 06152 TaxID=2777966 RepID=UPI00187FBA97|nr:M23 family metallopeptidase [Nodosilinea sp. LEGE 06152]MBE9156705.1 peptidoglycan DD-metalloendopeptidase family protein [Nodosilinea sp. LEGE 06152]
MARFSIKPYTVLITATGRAPIVLKLRPVPLLVGLGVLMGLPIAWIGLLLYQNVQLAQRNQNLSETASEVLTELNAIGHEIEVLKTRAGLPDREAENTRLPSDEKIPPRGGVAEVALAETMFDEARRQLPGIEQMLAIAVKPALEQTLESEAEQAAAFPSGKPIAGKADVSSEFGLRPNPFGARRYEMHEGLDFSGPVGKPILATAEGVIVRADYNGGYGNHVKIDHGYNYETLYAHMSKIEVKIGDRVQRGDVLGYLGSTGRSSGPHLHYSIYRNGRAVNPRYYLKLEETQ